MRYFYVRMSDTMRKKLAKLRTKIKQKLKLVNRGSKPFVISCLCWAIFILMMHLGLCIELIAVLLELIISLELQDFYYKNKLNILEGFYSILKSQCWLFWEDRRLLIRYYSSRICLISQIN